MNAQSNGPVTDKLIDFVTGLSFDQLPEAVRHECVRSFVDAIGCAVGAAQHSIMNTAHKSIAEFFGPPTTTVLGRNVKADALNAVLLNGTAGAAYSFFDTYSDALLHPSGPIVVALLALAEKSPMSGRDLLSAFAAGLEVACRLTKSIAVPPAQGSLSWSQGGIVCGIATAFACGKALGLNKKQMNWAVGIATTQCCGTRVAHGSMAAALIFGVTTQAGLRSALLAANDFTSSGDALADRHGFLSMFSAKANPSALVDDLGTHYELLSNTYKAFPCGIVIIPAIDAMLSVRREHQFASTDIARIALRVDKGGVTFGSRPNPKDDIEAKLSIQHWVAAAAARGKAGIAEGALDVVNDPEIRRLRGIIDLQGDDTFPSDRASIVVTLKDGRNLGKDILHAVGSITSPMSDKQLDDKFVDQVALVLGPERAKALAAACWTIEKTADARTIADLAR